MKFVCEPEANYSTGLRESMVFQGDAEVLLKQFPSNFFRCCITSPPYWGLRDYGTEGQIGAEEEPSDYICHLVAVFEQVYRVLTEDGTLWLNIGDSYTSGNRGYRAPDKKNPVRAMSYRAKTPDGLKPKDLIGIPWRLAFALKRLTGISAAILFGRNQTVCQKASRTDQQERTNTFSCSQSLSNTITITRASENQAAETAVQYGLYQPTHFREPTSLHFHKSWLSHVSWQDRNPTIGYLIRFLDQVL